VHRVQRKKNNLVLTQLDKPQKTRRPKAGGMEAKFGMKEISEMLNEEIEGVVLRVQTFGIFIDIGVRRQRGALAPQSFLPEGKLPKDFRPGQTVQCWVVETNEAEKKITVSLVAPPEGGFPQPKARK